MLTFEKTLWKWH